MSLLKFNTEQLAKYRLPLMTVCLMVVTLSVCNEIVKSNLQEFKATDNTVRLGVVAKTVLLYGADVLAITSGRGVFSGTINFDLIKPTIHNNRIIKGVYQHGRLLFEKFKLIASE